MPSFLHIIWHDSGQQRSVVIAFSVELLFFCSSIAPVCSWTNVLRAFSTFLSGNLTCVTNKYMFVRVYEPLSWYLQVAKGLNVELAPWVVPTIRGCAFSLRFVYYGPVHFIFYFGVSCQRRFVNCRAQTSLGLHKQNLLPFIKEKENARDGFHFFGFRLPNDYIGKVTVRT